MVIRMKRERIASIALIVVNIALIVAGIALYLGTDRKEPYFEFQAMDIIYEEGMDTSKLLEGISAYDNKDGDITDKIVIEKLIENRELNSVVVIYGVSDEAGNVAKCSREFAAIFTERPEEELSEGETEVQDGWLVQSGFWTELEGKGEAGGGSGNNEAAGDGTVGGLAGGVLSGDGEAESGMAGNGTGESSIAENRAAQGGAEENGVAKSQAGGNESTGNTAGENDEAAGRSENRQAENKTGEEGGIREQPDENRNREAGEETAVNKAGEGNTQGADEENAERRQERNSGSRNTHDPEAPILTLKVAEVKTSVGVGPAWVELIGTLSDDKDGYETLFRNLEVSKYDKNQPGTYQVTVSTKDSDGKRSQSVPLTIIVK